MTSQQDGPVVDVASAVSSQEREVLAALRTIIRATTFGARETGRVTGVGASHHLVLQLLELEGPRKAGEIATELFFSKATITVILDDLEERRLIERKRDESDARRVVVSITPSGKEALVSAPASLQSRFIGRFKALPGWERTFILAALQRVCDMLVMTSGFSG